MHGSYVRPPTDGGVVNVNVGAAGSAALGVPAWPVRAGVAPPLADGYSARPETAPGLSEALVPGATVALVPGRAAIRPGERPASCGKTQLAASAAGSLWRSGRVDLVAWVNASGRAPLLSGYGDAARAAGLDPGGTTEDVAARFTRWLACTTRPWLVVLDDLRDTADLNGLWPEGPAGGVLITTREEQTVAGRHGVRVLPVGPFSIREAVSFLMGRLTADPGQRLGAIDLAIALGCHPSTLGQACAVIAASGLSCRAYLDGYVRYRASLARQCVGDRPDPAAVTWALSAEQARRLSPGGATERLLPLAALLEGHPLPGTVFTTPAACAYLAQPGAPAPDPQDAWDAVRALEYAGLLVIDPATEPPSVWISPAVQVLVRAVTPGHVLDSAARAAADMLLEAWPADEPRAWPAASLRSCAARLLDAMPGPLWAAGRWHPVLLQAGRSFDAAVLTGPAASYWSQLTEANSKILGPDSPATLAAGSYLARALVAAGHQAEAVGWSQWVLGARTRELGTGHPETIAARVSLGRALIAANQPGHAATVLAQAVSEHEHACGPDHPGTLAARDELAAACHAAGNPARAIRYYQHTLTARQRISGPRHPDVTTAREKLAGACLADGRHRDAITQYKKVLADRERELGPDHPDTITARANLADACQTAGHIAAALRLHEQASVDCERVLGADHPSTLTRRAGLACAYYAAGRLADATTLMRDVVSRCERAQLPADPLIAALQETMTGMAED